MVRILGALILITGTASWGLMSAAELSRRVTDLRTMVAAMQLMRGEICSRLTPMPQVLKLVSAQTGSGVRKFFDNVSAGFSDIGSETFAQVWHSAARRTEELHLDRAQLLILDQLGQSLGKYDAARQEQALDYAIARFEVFSRQAEQEKQARARLHTFMGVAAGIFAVVILL